MNKFWWIIPVVIVVLILGILNGKRNVDLVRPDETLAPTTTPISAPKQYKFDRSTDLKKELDYINPQVLESDFEQ